MIAQVHLVGHPSSRRDVRGVLWSNSGCLATLCRYLDDGVTGRGEEPGRRPALDRVKVAAVAVMVRAGAPSGSA
ncbi:MAG: hypothetical protein JXX28_05100 [Deltaproteobacteria bacterium]|nr:hypothetical protein [Deltaproteobacteria bacterium]